MTRDSRRIIYKNPTHLVVINSPSSGKLVNNIGIKTGSIRAANMVIINVLVTKVEVKGL